jgi:DNA (cytosine-5)-methyltransferase 1
MAKSKKSIKKIATTIANLIPGQNQIDWDFETNRIISHIRKNVIELIYIDLFCGFGGTTAGVTEAKNKSNKNFAFVILGINHDDTALACHKAHNQDTLHLREDIRDVMLDPISKMVEQIRSNFPKIKVTIWTSAECTHHSRAKGGDSRDPDSRSLAEELYRYESAIKPDLIQVENVTEFRSWGPLMQKQFDMKLINLKEYKETIDDAEHGTLFSKNKTVWITKDGLAFKKDKKKGLSPWMIPIPERKAEYFNEWRDKLKTLGYDYDDRDINAADHGAFTSRNRYYGQFSKGLPIVWPSKTHCKDPEKHFLKFGYKLLKHNAVREVLDFSDTGDSIFVPGRIKSNQTFKRLVEGAIRHIAGGKHNYTQGKKLYEEWLKTGTIKTEEPEINDSGQFLTKYNSSVPSKDEYKHSVISVDKPSPTLPCRNMIYKPHFEFIFNENDRAQVLPFIIQFNNNCDLNSVDEPSRVVTSKEKFDYVGFIQQRNSGNPASKIVSIDGPARTITGTGGNQDLVQVEKILPYIFNYHGNGHNCHDINKPGPTICCADIHAIATMQSFIFHQYGTGYNQGTDKPTAALTNIPKCNLVSPKWIMDTNYKNIGKTIDEPAQTITADRHHAYIVNPSYFGHSTSVDSPSPVVVARQDKAPLHLAQVTYGNHAYYGIVIYNTDSEEIKELKYFMAIYGIVDIKMRMLKEMELLPIQGFPKDYIEKARLSGIKVSSTSAKKYIGNSQEVTTAKCLVEGYSNN